jgi:drug/metabolite transporter (DMT)-like permease
MRLSPLRADLLLLLAAALWGLAFIAQREAMLKEVDPLTFNAVRFTLGTLTVLPLLLFMKRAGPRDRAHRRRLVLGGALLGVVVALGMALQQIGLMHTEAGPAGFITGLYIVFTPIVGLLIGIKTTRATWVGIVLAIVGMWFLGVKASDDGSLHLQASDMLILLSALIWAVQVQIIGRLAPKTDPIELALHQFAWAAVLSFAAAAVYAGPEIAFGVHQIFATAPWEVLYAGVLAIGVAFVIQIIAQQKSPPSHAAIILGLEAPIAALGGWMILSERYGGREILGCALMLAGVLVSQAPRLFAKRP